MSPKVDPELLGFELPESQQDTRFTLIAAYFETIETLIVVPIRGGGAGALLHLARLLSVDLSSRGQAKTRCYCNSKKDLGNLPAHGYAGFDMIKPPSSIL